MKKPLTVAWISLKKFILFKMPLHVLSEALPIQFRQGFFFYYCIIMLHIEDIRSFLEEKYIQYNTVDFIPGDPVEVPHMFSCNADIEIAGFLTAVISWGRRESITRAGKELMRLMDFEPAAFVRYAGNTEIAMLDRFVYRTFNGLDVRVFVLALRNLLPEYGSLENAFFYPIHSQSNDMSFIISRFKKRFFNFDHPSRTRKHLPDPLKNSAAKRINMFLRWMVRNDKRGVDFGIWKNIGADKLVCPLDIHSGEVARKLGLLTRRQNDWKSATELTKNLLAFDPFDPVKYDFALFGLGWYEHF